MREDRPFQLLELSAGLEPELLDERASCILVGGERVSLSSGAIEGEHQLRPRALPEWVLLHERFELGNEVVVAAKSEVAVDPVHERGEPFLPSRSTSLRANDSNMTSAAGASPERERLAEEGFRTLLVAVLRQQATLVREATEAPSVQVVTVDVEQIARRASDDQVASQQLAELRDVGLHNLDRGRGRAFAPQLVDQAWVETTSFG